MDMYTLPWGKMDGPEDVCTTSLAHTVVYSCGVVNVEWDGWMRCEEAGLKFKHHILPIFSAAWDWKHLTQCPFSVRNDIPAGVS